jgi:drug/metabolite transporter (DMT)-like permease
VDAGAQALRVGAAWGAYPGDLWSGGSLAADLGVRASICRLWGIFIALALAWGVLMDGFRPDRWDLLGAAICVAGVVVMVAPPRS